MRKKEKDSGYWIAVLLVGLALGVIAGLAIAGFAYPIYQSNEWAAWVQAIGSVLAILAAIWISRAQSREKVNEAKSERLHVLKTCLGMAESMEHHISLLEKDLIKYWQDPRDGFSDLDKKQKMVEATSLLIKNSRFIEKCDEGSLYGLSTLIHCMERYYSLDGVHKNEALMEQKELEELVGWVIDDVKACITRLS